MQSSGKVTLHIDTAMRGMRVLECDPHIGPECVAHLLSSRDAMLTIPAGEGSYFIWHTGPISQWSDTHVFATEAPSLTLVSLNVRVSYNGDFLRTILFPSPLLGTPQAIESLYRQIRNSDPVLPPAEMVTHSFSPDTGIHYHPRFKAVYKSPNLPPYSTPLMNFITFIHRHHCPRCYSCVDRFSNCLGGVVTYISDEDVIHEYTYQCPPVHIPEIVNKNSRPTKMAEHVDADSDDDGTGEYEPDSDVDEDYEAYSEDEYANGKGDWSRFSGNSKKKNVGLYHPLAHFQEFVTSRNGTENVVIPPGVAEEIEEYLVPRRRPANTATVREALGHMESFPWTKDRYAPYYFNAARIASIINHKKAGVLPPHAIPKVNNDLFRKLYLQFYSTWCDLPEAVKRGRRIMPRANIIFYYLCHVAADLYKDDTWLGYLALSPTPDGGPPRLQDDVVQASYAEITRAVSIRNNWTIVPL